MEGLRGALAGEPPPEKRPSRPRKVQGRAFVQALVKRIDLIKFPELVIGFKVKDQALAKEQLDQLELNLQMVLAQAAALAEPPEADDHRRPLLPHRSSWTARWSPGIRGSWRRSAPWPRLPTTAIS